ncbi:MAG: acyl carrier protein [Opitutaceae bacterium]|nr:acyl carrier protein [Opitutaceae bacterium]
MHSDLLRLIDEVRANKKQPPASGVTRATRLREELGFASLDLAELTVRIEERFGVDVFADGLVQTVGELDDKITRAGKK